MSAIHTYGEAREGALVLLPPFPFDSRLWEAVASQLEGLPVVTVDPPGFSGDQVPVTPSLEAYASSVVDKLRGEGIRRVLVAGCSMGGYTALTMLERYPKMVAAIGLFGTHAGPDSAAARAGRTEAAVRALAGSDMPARAEGTRDLLGASSRKDEELVHIIRSWAAEAPAEAVAWCQRAMAGRPGRLHVLQRANIPGIVVRGIEDPVTSPEQATAMAEALQTQVIEVPRCGHLVPIEAPSIVARHLGDLYKHVFG